MLITLTILFLQKNLRHHLRDGTKYLLAVLESDDESRGSLKDDHVYIPISHEGKCIVAWKMTLQFNDHQVSPKLTSVPLVNKFFIWNSSSKPVRNMDVPISITLSECIVHSCQ